MIKVIFNMWIAGIILYILGSVILAIKICYYNDIDDKTEAYEPTKYSIAELITQFFIVIIPILNLFMGLYFMVAILDDDFYNQLIDKIDDGDY